MIAGIGDHLSASAAANVLLREFGNARRSGASSAGPEIQSVQSTGGIRGKSELTDEERKEVEKLKRRDQEVRRHEAAHKAAAGPHAKGGADFEFTTGPDGRRYATGGEVQIDTSKVPGDPQATIKKMQQIRRAAGAPAEPSAQDRRVAAQAATIESQARAELARRRSTNNHTIDDSGSASGFLNVRPQDPGQPFAGQVQQRPDPGTFIDLTV